MHMKPQLNIRKNFAVWETKDRNGLPREGVEFCSLSRFQTHLGTILCHVLYDDPA